MISIEQFILSCIRLRMGSLQGLKIVRTQRERHYSDQIKYKNARTSKPKPDMSRNQSEPKIELEVEDIDTMSSGSDH